MSRENRESHRKNKKKKEVDQAYSSHEKKLIFVSIRSLWREELHGAGLDSLSCQKKVNQS